MVLDYLLFCVRIIRYILHNILNPAIEYVARAVENQLTSYIPIPTEAMW